MPRNGSGVFNAPSNNWNPAVATVEASAADWNETLEDIGLGITNSLAKDGQTPATANLPMGGFKHTGVAAGSSRTDYTRLDQAQDGKTNWAEAGGTADAITATYSPVITALVDGQECYVRAGAANATTTPTFAPNSLDPEVIVKNGGLALAVGDIVGAGHELHLRYDLDNTRWELLNPSNADKPSLAGNNAFTGANTHAGAETFTGKILFPDDGELTIAAGAVTVTGKFHTLDTESDAASDDLDTINGLADGQEAVFRIENSARNVVITNAGNIITPNGLSITLDTTSQTIAGIYDGALSKFLVVSSSESIATETVAGITKRATNATTQTGAATDEAVTPANMRTALGFSKSFESSQQTITAGGTLTLAHGLAGRPKLVWAVLQCTTANLNYSIGDEVPYGPFNDYDGSNSRGIGLYLADTSNIGVRFASDAISVINKSTGVLSNITTSSWRLVVRALG